MTELKLELKKQNLPTAGKKSDMILRLLENNENTGSTGNITANNGGSVVCPDDATTTTTTSNTSPGLELELDFNTLRTLNITRGLPIDSKSTVQSLQSQLKMDLMTNAKVVNKTRDVVIETIGMVPTDFTPKGRYIGIYTI